MPREQCQGRQKTSLLTAYTNLAQRHSQLCRQLHHPDLQLRRESSYEQSIPEQVEPCPCIDTKARVAAQLAYIYQRDHIFLPHESLDMRE